MQYGISSPAASISELSSGKIDECEYVTGKELLSPQQHRIIDKAKFNYSSIGKAFKKQTENIED